MWSEIGNLVCLRHFFTSTAVANYTYFFKSSVSLHTCATCSELPSNIRTMALHFFSWRTIQYLNREQGSYNRWLLRTHGQRDFFFGEQLCFNLPIIDKNQWQRIILRDWKSYQRALVTMRCASKDVHRMRMFCRPKDAHIFSPAYQHINNICVRYAKSFIYSVWFLSVRIKNKEK